MQVFIYFTRSILEWHDMVAFHNDSDYMQINRDDDDTGSVLHNHDVDDNYTKQ